MSFGRSNPLAALFDPSDQVACWAGTLDRTGFSRRASTPQDMLDAGRRIGPARDAFLLRRGWLRGLVAAHLSLPVEHVVVGYGPGGVPRVVKPEAGPFVSVSGRGFWAALAVAARPIGIDMEPLEPHHDAVWTALAPEERTLLEREDRAVQGVTFLKYWTAKEAYLKALGVGLTRDPAGVVIRWREAEGFTVEDAGATVPGEGRSRVGPIGDKRFAIAVFLGRARAD